MNNYESVSERIIEVIFNGYEDRIEDVDIEDVRSIDELEEMLKEIEEIKKAVTYFEYEIAERLEILRKELRNNPEAGA